MATDRQQAAGVKDRKGKRSRSFSDEAPRAVFPSIVGRITILLSMMYFGLYIVVMVWHVASSSLWAPLELSQFLVHASIQRRIWALTFQALGWALAGVSLMLPLRQQKSSWLQCRSTAYELADAFSIAATLTAIVFALGDVSEAHFNPAAFTYSFTRKSATYALGAIGEFTWRWLDVSEAVFTFVLCYVGLSGAVSKRTEASHVFGLAIRSCFTVGGCAIGGIYGGICILLLMCTGGPRSQNLCSPVAARAGFQVLCGTEGVDYLGAALAYSQQQLVKVVGLFGPLVKGCMIGLFGGARVGTTVVIIEPTYITANYGGYSVFADVDERTREGSDLDYGIEPIATNVELQVPSIIPFQGVYEPRTQGFKAFDGLIPACVLPWYLAQ